VTTARVPSVLAWLVGDTFRQSRASGIFWLMLAVSAVCAAACLTAVEVAEPPPAAPASAAPASRLEIAFGLIRAPLTGDRNQAVRGVQLQLAAWVADAAGMLLVLIWTAGLLPSFFDPNAAVVLFAKPAPRWALLTGKILGVLLFVAFQASAFVGATYLALGARTGVWDPTYFLCVPLLLLHFAVFFSFSAMLAATTRSTAACVFGSVVFWLFCWALNFGRHAALLLPEVQQATGGGLPALEWCYWALPKPLDFHEVLVDLLQARGSGGQLVNVPGLAAHGAWAPGLSLLASAACAVVLLGVTAYEVYWTEY
jgi:hypothetical protein